MVRSLAARGGVVAVAALMVACAAGTALAQCDTGGDWNPDVTSPYVRTSANAIVRCANGDYLIGGVTNAVAGYTAMRWTPATNRWKPLSFDVTGGTINGMAEMLGGDVILCGNFGAPLVNSNVARYTPGLDQFISSGFAGAGSGLCALTLPSGDVLVGGGFDSGVNPLMKLDSGGNWTSVPGLAPAPATASALRLLASGDVLVSGNFTSAGGNPALRIATYNLSTGVWSPLGGGISAPVKVMVELPNGDIVVGGGITSAGGVPVNRIARYTPATGVWSAMGDGLTGTVNGVVALPSGDVVAAGQLTASGAVPIRNIARFSMATQTWSEFGGGLSTVAAPGFPTSSASALTKMPDGSLLVAGQFNRAGSVAVNGFAQYRFFGAGPGVTTQPQDAAGCAGGGAVFSAAGSGAGVAYQWQVEAAGPGGSVWTNVVNSAGPGETVSGATGATLTLGALVQRPPVRFRCLISNACGTTTTSAAQLTIGGSGCPGTCGSADFNGDGDIGTDSDIESFFRVLSGGHC